MTFVNVRELHINTTKVLSKVSKGEKVVVTNKGKPQAIISSLKEKDIENIILVNDLLIASESALKKDWLRPEEDKAWGNL